ncbi:MAG: Hsp20/alpha crystallin family protein [Fibrobacteria bacterium]
MFNAYESKDEFIIAAIVPGIAKDAIDIRFDEGAVTLSGSRSMPNGEGPDRKFLRQERAHGEFEKIVRFPAQVNPAGITAKLDNGILVIRAPKAEAAKPKQIEIRN